MPNFGRLTDDLFCRTLTIGDRMVLDQNLNLIVGNVFAGNLECVLFTSKIVEQSSMSGVTIYGNLHIQPGFYLTGNIDLTGVMLEDVNASGNINIGKNCCVSGDVLTDKITSKTNPLTLGPSLFGASSVQGSLTVSGLITSAQLCSDSILVNTLSGKNTDLIELEGDLALTSGNIFVHNITGKLDGVGPLITGNTTINGNLDVASSIDCNGLFATSINCNGLVATTLLCDQFSSKSGIAVDIIGNINMLDGGISMYKSTNGPSVSNILSSDTPSGTLYFEATGNLSPQLSLLIMNNPFVTANSVVVASIGNYVGSGLPLMQQTTVSPGQVDFYFLNLNTIFTGEYVPINYIIV